MHASEARPRTPLMEIADAFAVILFTGPWLIPSKCNDGFGAPALAIRTSALGPTAGLAASDRHAQNLPFTLARRKVDLRVHPQPALRLPCGAL